ncbi:MAG: CRTAC1 family protein [Thermoanaerobaculia bacterium]
MRRVTPAWRYGVFVVATMLVACGSDREEPTIPIRLSPPQLADTARLATLGEEQRKTASRFAVFHGFRFTDRLPESGITFRQEVTPDSARALKAIHYDHGTGLAVADVDGDRRLDVYFVDQMGDCELWRNRGDGTFENTTAAAGVALPGRVKVTASFADADNDGDPDLFVTTVRHGNVLFANDGQGRFRDVTAEAGLGYVGHSSGAVFFDYDNDGLLDLFLANVGVYTQDHEGPGGGYFEGTTDAFGGHLLPERTEPSILYRNLGGLRFQDVSQATGLLDTGWSGDAAFADLSGDRYPDLYVLNMQGDDHYWENQPAPGGGRRFVERTAERFPRTPWGTMGIKFFDFDNDTDLDLVLTDMHSDMSHEIPPGEERLKSVIEWDDAFLQGGSNNIFGNAFWENLGDGRFREVSDPLGIEQYWPWGVTAADLNADGWEDLFIAASMSFPFHYGVNSVLLNDGGNRFVDSEFVLGIEPRRDGRTHVPWFDLDCDGADAEHPRCAGRQGRFTVMGTLGTRSTVAFDLEGDGDLDVVTNEFGAEPQVLLSDLAQRRPVHWLQVRLVGTASNRDGLGAAVRVHAGDRLLLRVHDGKSGYLSQSSMPLYIGLGDLSQVDRIEVAWPSGRTSELPGPIASNQTLEFREP